ncbi:MULTISPECIES: 2'-5' RNA ligase family protein [unclassified Streptomyces]|uniref:2'-5' RNA ligase family protein n=1 Tax=unclassified Streptomyces TaxID=2593676 RepID=UPI00363FB517
MSVIHAYLLPRPGVDDELMALAHACRPVLLNHPIDPAASSQTGDPGTLHITLDMIADAPSARISHGERQDMIGALHEELAGIAPFDTEVGPPISTVAGAVLDVWPEDEAVALQNRVRSTIRRTRGDRALQHSSGRLHMSLGYSYGPGDSDVLNSQLRNGIRPRRAPMHVDTVHLLNVRYDIAVDTGGWRMAWESLAEIPLGTRIPASPRHPPLAGPGTDVRASDIR